MKLSRLSSPPTSIGSRPSTDGWNGSPSVHSSGNAASLFFLKREAEESALILGDGDGRFAARLLHENPEIRIEAVDASDAMLRELVRRAGGDAVRVRARLADARRLNFPAANFDLVATHFFLDCLTTEEVATLANKLHTRMAPGAAWVVSEFAIPNTIYGRLIASTLVSALYLAFRFLTGLSIRRLPDHRQALKEAGFLLTKQRSWLGGLLVSEMWEPAPPEFQL